MSESPPPQPPVESTPPPPPSATGSPTEFLKNVVGKRVVVRLTSGVDYRGKVQLLEQETRLTMRPIRPIGVLSCLDGYMNIALEQTEEHVNGHVSTLR